MTTATLYPERHYPELDPAVCRRCDWVAPFAEHGYRLEFEDRLDAAQRHICDAIRVRAWRLAGRAAVVNQTAQYDCDCGRVIWVPSDLPVTLYTQIAEHLMFRCSHEHGGT